MNDIKIEFIQIHQLGHLIYIVYALLNFISYSKLIETRIQEECEYVNNYILFCTVETTLVKFF